MEQVARIACWTRTGRRLGSAETGLHGEVGRRGGSRLRLQRQEDGSNCGKSSRVTAFYNRARRVRDAAVGRVAVRLGETRHSCRKPFEIYELDPFFDELQPALEQLLERCPTRRQLSIGSIAWGVVKLW